MNRALLAALAASVSVVGSLGNASAADIAARAPAPVYLKAPPAAPFSWEGFYIGGHGGWAHDEFDFFTAITTTPDESSKGAFGGVQAGYNFQRGNIVAGVEADASFGKLADVGHDGNFLTESTEIKEFGTARARVGYAFGQVLPYVTGGLGWANVTGGDACPAGAMFGTCRPQALGGRGPFSLTANETYFGWTAGAGLEMAVNRNWSVKAEFLHADLGSKFIPVAAPGFPISPALKMDTVKAGVNYRF
jgi:outer membrane immunogenic protein